SSGSSSSRARLAAAIAARRVPMAAMPRSASATAATSSQLRGWKKSAKAGSATISARTRKAVTPIVLPSQIALRSHGASTRPSSNPCSRSAENARVRPRSAVKTIAIQSSPVSARADEPDGSAKWKTASAETTKSSMAGNEPLEHAAGECPGPLIPRVPEAEALEHRAAALAPFGDPVQAPVEVEVLERGQLAVDERLVSEEADRFSGRVHLELAARRCREPG